MSVLIPVEHSLRHAWMAAVVRARIAVQCRALRESRGLTQKDLARKIGTKQSAISLLENPRARFPSVTTLLRVTQAFDVALIIEFAGWEEWLTQMANVLPPPMPFDLDDLVGLT